MFFCAALACVFLSVGQTNVTMDADVHARGNDVVARSFGVLENVLVQHAVLARAQQNMGVFPLYACAPDTSKETNVI